MESVLSTKPGNYEQGKVIRLQFIEGATIFAATAAPVPAALAAEPVAPMTSQDQGLTPKEDLESALVRDPDNLIVQTGDVKMGLDTGYPPSSQ